MFLDLKISFQLNSHIKTVKITQKNLICDIKLGGKNQSQNTKSTKFQKNYRISIYFLKIIKIKKYLSETFLLEKTSWHKK